MTTAVEVGVGYVSVIPSARGYASELQRQIARPTEQVAGRVGEQAGQATGRRMLASLGTALKVGVVAVAAGAGVLFAEAFTQAIEQDASNAKLAAQLGLSPKESQRVGQIAGAVYAKGYGESIDQVNESLRTLTQAGIVAVGAPRKEVEGLTKSALTLAQTFDVEVGDAAKAAGQLIRTGMVKDAKQAFDLITVGFQQGADKSGDFLDTLNEYSTQWRDLGLDGSAAIGLITQGLRAGARDADIVADALKEFAIRAKDGSETSKDGFEALGLSASTMASAFTSGGPKAAAALDQVLDRLRAIPDPVKRSQTAVLLFGTQAEDLQQSLFALDPSAAVASLGNVAGAADRAGQALHGSAAASFEAFKRQVLQGLVEFINRNILPGVMAFGAFLIDYVLPVLQRVGAAFEAWLLPALAGAADAFMVGVEWLREYGAWLLPLGVAIAGLTITLNASAIATGAVTAVFAVYRGVLMAAAAVTRGYAIVQGLLNAVMRANPIGLIITGIAALATLLVVAYNKSDTFRGIVQATWAGIQAGWSALWEGYLRPGLAGLMTGLRAIGAAASWVWSTILSPVFSAIGLAARVLFAILATVLIAPVVILIRGLGAAGAWLWNVALGPAFRAIGAMAVLLYRTYIKPAFDGVLLVLRAVGAGATWLWTSAIRPALQAIGSLAGWLYNSVIKPTFAGVLATLRAVGAGASWLWSTAIRPAFQAIGALASWLWTRALKPALDAGGRAVRMFGDAFGVARDAIKLAWSQIEGIAKKPVNFIIEWVYTKGIKATWDKIAGFVGLGKLPAAPKLLAAGGTVGDGWGPAAPMKVNRPTAIVGEGDPRHPEFVIPTDPKYRGRALALWQAAGTQLMADGGILGGAADWLSGAARQVGSTVMSGVDFLSDPGRMWEKATAFIRDRIRQIGSSRWAQMLARVPMKMLTGLKDKILSAVTGLVGDDGGDGGTWARPVSAALGTRYGVAGRMWSSGYHTGTDFPAATGTAVRAAAMGIVQSALSGGPYGNHISIAHGGGLSSLYAHLSSMAVRAGQPVTRGMRIGAVGATGNTTGPHLHFEARRGGRTINPEPLLGYDSGGWLLPGVTPAINKTGRPEAVLTPRQWTVAQAAIGRAVAAAPRAVPGGAGGGLQAGDRLRLVVGGREFEAYVEEIADGVIEDTMMPVATAIAGMRG
jgi:hypothetical protein